MKDIKRYPNFCYVTNRAKHGLQLVYNNKTQCESVCVSVCLCVCVRYYAKTAEPIDSKLSQLIGNTV